MCVSRAHDRKLWKLVRQNHFLLFDLLSGSIYDMCTHPIFSLQGPLKIAVTSVIFRSAMSMRVTWGIVFIIGAHLSRLTAHLYLVSLQSFLLYH